MYFDFIASDGRKIEILKINAGHLMKMAIQADLGDPVILQQYGGVIYLLREIILIDSRVPNLNDIINLDAPDYLMILDCVNVQSSTDSNIKLF